MGVPALIAASQSARKARGISQGPEGWRYDFDRRVAIAPDGTKYPWKGAGDPTEADLDEVIAGHRSSKTATVVKGGPKNPKGLIGSAVSGALNATEGQRRAALKRQVQNMEPLDTLNDPSPGPSFSDITKNVLEPASKIISETAATVGEYTNPLALSAKGLAEHLPAARPVEKAISGVARGGGRLVGGVVDVPGMLALASNPNPKVLAQGFYDTVQKTWAPESSVEDRVVGLGTAVLTLLGLKHGVSSFREFAKNRNAAALEAGLKKAGATDAQAQGAAMAAERAAGPKVEPEAKTTIANPKPSPEPPPAGEPPSTGLANQVQGREAEAGILKDIPATAGKSPEHWQQVGKKQFGEDYDFEALASRVANGDEELTGAKVGILLEGKRRLMAERNRLSQRVKDSPGDKAAKEALAAHDERIDAFVRDVQIGKGAWSDVGRALQAGATLDEGNFAQVLERAKETGRTPSAAWQADTENLSAELTRVRQELEDLKSGAQSVRQVKTRLSKDNILKEIDDIGAEWEKLKTAGTGSRNPKVTKTTGAILVTKADLAKLGKRGELIARYIKAHAKLGAASVEEFVKTVKVNLLEKLGVDVGDQLVIDVAADTAARPSPTDLQRQSASLRAKLKRASTKGETDRIADLERQIQENKAALENPELQAKPPLPRVVSERVKQLEAEAKIYASRVRGKLRAHEEGFGKRLAQGAAQTVRGSQLGMDVGILTRQGLFSLSRPLDFAKGVGSGLKAAISETKLAAMEKALDERVVNGRKAIVAEKESGLQRTSHFGGFNQQEELTLARLFQAVPELAAKGLDKIGAKPVGAVVRKAGQLGGSLERFQHAFINKVRAEAFDRALKLGYSADELKARARFINNATGRGNFKNVPTALQFVMTSPRYEASRWAMLAEPFRNPGRILADLAKRRGLNRGAVANLQDMAITAAEVYGLYKLAEGAGYSVDFDPTSSDFLKLRKGKEVWDPTAGMAPRLRDTIRVAVAFVNPEYAKERDFDLQSAVGKAATRTISPAVRTPIEQSYQAVQRRQGIDEAKLRSFFTGRTIDPEDAKGWFAFAPLIVQTFWQTLQEEDPKAAWEAGLKEFVGQSINRYPKPGGK